MWHKIIRKSQYWSSHGRMSGLWQIAKCVIVNKESKRKAEFRFRVNEAVEAARLRRKSRPGHNEP